MPEDSAALPLADTLDVWADGCQLPLVVSHYRLAADLIRSLQAENERLRDRLQRSLNTVINAELETENAALDERLAATEASRDNANYALRRANEELAATEAVAKRLLDGWHPSSDENDVECWIKQVGGWWDNPEWANELMSDAECQVLDRLNEASDDA